ARRFRQLCPSVIRADYNRNELEGVLLVSADAGGFLPRRLHRSSPSGCRARRRSAANSCGLWAKPAADAATSRAALIFRARRPARPGAFRCYRQHPQRAVVCLRRKLSFVQVLIRITKTEAGSQMVYARLVLFELFQFAVKSLSPDVQQPRRA